MNGGEAVWMKKKVKRLRKCLKRSSLELVTFP